MKKVFLSLLCCAGIVGTSACAGLEDLMAFLDERANEEQIDDEEEGEDGEEEGEVSAGITTDEMNEKGYAIKLSYTSVEGYSSDNGSLVYTRKGKKYRWDTVTQSSVYAYYYDRATESGYQYYDEEWTEYDYYRCQQTVNNLFSEWVNDCSSLLKNYGFEKTGTTKILDLPCDVWTGTYSKEGKAFGAVAYGAMTKEGAKGEFCVWNGLTLRTKVDGKVQTECAAIVVGIDDKAFSQTVDISWIE